MVKSWSCGKPGSRDGCLQETIQAKWASSNLSGSGENAAAGRPRDGRLSKRESQDVGLMGKSDKKKSGKGAALRVRVSVPRGGLQRRQRRRRVEGRRWGSKKRGVWLSKLEKKSRRRQGGVEAAGVRRKKKKERRSVREEGGGKGDTARRLP